MRRGLSTVVSWLRSAVAGRLFRLASIVEVRSDEDPFAWEVSAVKVAASADSRQEALGAVREVTARLDDRTIRMVLLLLAADAVWSDGLGSPVKARDWAADRKFNLMVKDFDDVER